MVADEKNASDGLRGSALKNPREGTRPLDPIYGVHAYGVTKIFRLMNVGRIMIFFQEWSLR